MVEQFNYEWNHKCHGFLGVFKSMEDLIRTISKGPYPIPNTAKMKEQLSKNDEFSYAIGLLTVKKTPVTFNP